MKLWDSLTTCLFLLSSVHASPPTQPRRQPSTRDPPERPLETPPVKIPVPTDPAASSRAHTDKDDLGRMADQEQHVAGERLLKEEHLLEEERLLEERLVEERLVEQRADSVRGATLNRKPGSASPSASPSSSPSAASVNTRSRARHRRGRKKTVSVRSTGGERGGGGAKEAQRRKGRRGRGGQGCMLKQIHLNVSDLGLGYRSEEEMIFRYCSGPCRKSETNYDKILHNIAHRRRLGARDTPRDACCRPTAFDDDLSFLDDDLVYHTIRKHSARKCGCV